MNTRCTLRAASAVTALVLIGACSDDGPTTLARGEGVELVGDEDLAGQTLTFDAEVDDGEVTGELRFADPGGEVVVALECADTHVDGVVTIGGSATGAGADDFGTVALFIRKGSPDSVAVWTDPEGTSCDDLIAEQGPAVLADEGAFVDVESGSEIETG